MLQFEVPQFIDIEDKIIGPFTLKQFGFVGGGTLIIVVLFRILHFSIGFFLLSLPLALFTLGISFGTFNGRKIYNTIPIFIEYITAPKIYIYSKQKISSSEMELKPMVLTQENQSNADLEPPQSRLRQLTALLEQKNKEEYQIVNGRRE